MYICYQIVVNSILHTAHSDASYCVIFLQDGKKLDQDWCQHRDRLHYWSRVFIHLSQKESGDNHKTWWFHLNIRESLHFLRWQISSYFWFSIFLHTSRISIYCNYKKDLSSMNCDFTQILKTIIKKCTSLQRSGDKALILISTELCIWALQQHAPFASFPFT